MVVPSALHLQAFAGGQMTDLPEFSGDLDLTALMEIVSPGNVDEGINYSITLRQFAILITGGNPTFVVSGASYNSISTDTRILVNKTVGSATAVLLDSSVNYGLPVLVKDLKGDADANPITVTFTGGQRMDGLSSVVIANPYGYFWFNPLAAGGWYDAAF